MSGACTSRSRVRQQQANIDRIEEEIIEIESRFGVDPETMIRDLVGGCRSETAEIAHWFFLRQLRDRLRPEAKLGDLILDFQLAIGSKETKKIRKGYPAQPWAPTLNEYAALRPWQCRQLRDAIDGCLLVATSKARLSALSMGILRAPSKGGKLGALLSAGSSRKRIVVVTRRSSAAMDEISADTIGGKMPIDRLVHWGILREDSERWCERRVRFEKCKRGRELVLIQVHETA